MDWLQFTAAIVGHLAWPTVIFVLFVILRKHMGALADRLLEFSFGGAKITFDKILQRGAEIIEHSSQPKTTDESQLKPDPPAKAEDSSTSIFRGRQRTIDKKYEPKAFQQALGDETGAERIIWSYEAVNRVIRAIGAKMGFAEDSGVDERMILFTLANRDAITREIFDLYVELSSARNLISHARTTPSWSEVVEYTRQASFLVSVLIRLKDKIDRGEIKVT
jgi:hypothetical protein